MLKRRRGGILNVASTAPFSPVRSWRVLRQQAYVLSFGGFGERAKGQPVSEATI